MELSTHKKLAALINTTNANAKQIHKICVKNQGSGSVLVGQLKVLLDSLTSVKQQLLEDLEKESKPYINPYDR